MTDRWTDGQTDGKIMFLSHNLTMRGGHVASLSLGGGSATEHEQTQDVWKNSVALAHPYHEGKS